MPDAPGRKVMVAAEDALHDGMGMVVKADDTAVALFRVEGQCYAVANACPHRGGPLGQGKLEGHVVTCPWHGWTWDVRTGANARNPSVKKLTCFPVTIENGEIFVELV